MEGPAEKTLHDSAAALNSWTTDMEDNAFFMKVTVYCQVLQGRKLICTSVVPCLSSGLAKNDKIISMFVSFSQFC